MKIVLATEAELKTLVKVLLLTVFCPLWIAGAMLMWLMELAHDLMDSLRRSRFGKWLTYG